MESKTRYTVHYAEDQVILDDADIIGYMVKKIEEEYARWDLTVNFQKTYLGVDGAARNYYKWKIEIL